MIHTTSLTTATTTHPLPSPRFLLWVAIFAILTPVMETAEKAAVRPEIANSPARETAGLLDRMLAGPLKDVPSVICVLRNNIEAIEGDYGYILETDNLALLRNKGLSYSERLSLKIPSPVFASGPSRILRVDLKTRKISTLFEDSAGGVVRDPVVHYDAQKILFSMRKAGKIRYHIYEVNVDGTGLRQLTDGSDDEVDPCYLPDGGIVYASSKAHRFTPCNQNNIGNLWRCDGDGRNQRRLTNGMDADRYPWVLPDGRIVFSRWDYVHRPANYYFGLWTLNPDGTGQMAINGNSKFYDLGYPGYAKPIPGSSRLVSTIAWVHSLTGVIATIDPLVGPDDYTSIQITSLGNPPTTLDLINKVACRPPPASISKSTGPDGRPLRHHFEWADPYPITEDCFLVTSWDTSDRYNGFPKSELCVMDGKGNYEVIVSIEPEKVRTNEKINIEGTDVTLKNCAVLMGARPLMPRRREPVIANRTDWSKKTGTMILANMYDGRQFAEVKKGSIKSLMIMENLPLPLKYTGSTDMNVSLGENVTLAKYWGSVPVESDGSAYFEVPAVRSLSFLAVDEAGREVKYMRAQATVMPGEVVSCVGCHEERTHTPNATSGYAGNLQALRRPPSQPLIPSSIRHTPVSFVKDIQPILDRHCVSCHNSTDMKGKIVLENDRTPKWSVSYEQLFTAKQIRTAGHTKGDDPVRPMMAAVSPFIEKLRGGHHEVKASPEEILTARIWIDEDAKYAPYTMAYWSGRMSVKDPVPPCDTSVLIKRCDSCHGPDSSSTDKTKRVIEDSKAVDANKRYCGEAAWPLKDDFYPDANPIVGDMFMNLDHPEKSLLLRAPLAKEAGGLGWCLQTDAPSKLMTRRYKADAPAAIVFASKDDPDYQALLTSIQKAHDYFHKNIRRFDMPNYQPNAWLVRYWKDWGILLKDYDVAKDGWDAEKMDDLYFDHAIWPETGP